MGAGIDLPIVRQRKASYLNTQKIFDFHARLVPHPTSVERLLRMMDQVRIERAVVSAGGVIPLPQLSMQIIEGGSADIEPDNDFVLSGCARSGGRLVPFFFANLSRDPTRYRNHGAEFAGLELAPAVHGVPLTDDRTAALVRVAWEMGHAVYLHCLIRDGFGVKDLVALAQRFPRVNFVLGHSGIGHMDLYGIDLISQCRNVFLETSGGYTFVVRYALERLGCERVLFGSEYPIQHPAVELAKFQTLDLDAVAWERIAWGNAYDLLNMATSPATSCVPPVAEELVSLVGSKSQDDGAG